MTDLSPSTVPLPSGELNLPEGLNYHCIACGKSCGEFWEIGVEPGREESIRARPPEELRATGVADPTNPVVESPWTPGQNAMRLNERHQCAMLTHEGLCGLHKLWGLHSKPNICQSFPYRFLETPRGTFVGVSFACTAVMQNVGPAVTAQRAELHELHAYTLNRRQLAEPPDLTNDIPLSWEQYEGIERDLADLLDPRHGPLPRRLIAQSLYVNLLSRFLREARMLAGRMTGGPEANEAALAAFARQMRGDADDPWPRIMRLADRRRASALWRRTFLGFAHALRNTYGQRRGRWRSYTMVIAAYFRNMFGRGVVDLPVLPRPVSYAELRRVRFDPDAPEFDELLTRYFRHRLFRKDLLAADDIHYAIQLQLLHWGLIHWYAAAITAAEQPAPAKGATDKPGPELELRHLHEGLRNVEKYFVFHSTFDRLFKSYPMLRSLTDRIFEHPLYAYTMGRGEWEGPAGP